MERQQAIGYLRAPANGLWRWADGGTVVVWNDGSTIAFREELMPILEWLEPHGLPSFGTVILLLAALRGKVPAEAQILSPADSPLPAQLGEKAQLLLNARRQLKLQLEVALGELQKLTGLPAELRSGLKAKCVLAEAIFEPARAERHGHGRELLRGWQEVIPETELNYFSADPRESSDPRAGNLIRQIHVLAEGLRPHTPESLALRMKTGLDALPGPAPLDLPSAERARRLLDELSQDPEQGALVRAARELMAAIRLPRNLGEREELALGGVADLTNRGPLDRLLLSELAHDDLTLAVRVALNEALYLRREPPLQEPPGTLGLLLDSGIRLWGIPRLLAGAVALALAACDRRHTQVLAWRAQGKEVKPVDILTRPGLISHLGALEVEAHPGAALPAFAAALPVGQLNQTVVITHPDALQDPEFRRALGAQQADAGFVATVDRAGRFELHTLPLAHRPPICQASLDLNQVFTGQGRVTPLLRPDRRTDLPASFGVAPFPLLLPFPESVERWTTDADGEIYAVLTDRRLIRFREANKGGRLLAAGLPPGKTVWMGVVDGMVHVVRDGSIKRPVRLVSVPVAGGSARVFDLQAGTELLAAHVYGPVLLLIRQNKVRAFSLADGRFLNEATHSYGWVGGRFFASAAQFYCATWDGQAVRIESVSLPNPYSPSVIALLFDRVGTEGPWMVHRQGEVLCTATGQKFHLPLPGNSISGFESVRASPGGQIIYASMRPTWNCTLDLRTGKVQHSPPHPGLAEPAWPPFSSEWPLSMPRWNIYRVQDSIAASLAGGISLCGRKGRWRELRPGPQGRLHFIDSPASPDNVRHCLVFSACPAPSQFGCLLQVASWIGGSKAFLDSRGLLHLKSHDAAVPEITLVLAESEVAGWTSEGYVCGPSFFIGDQKSEPERVWAAIQKFLESL